MLGQRARRAVHSLAATRANSLPSGPQHTVGVSDLPLFAAQYKARTFLW